MPSMYHASLRSSAQLVRALRQPVVSHGAMSASRRLIGTAAATPKPKNGTWKSTAVRWGLAAGALYWYNTSPIFSDEAAYVDPIAPAHEPEAELQTIDTLLEEKQQQEAEKKRAAAALESVSAATLEGPSAATPKSTTAEEGSAGGGTPEDLEEESQQGAFNPETGEINWDCPCLGGMAHGPCGDEFKAAFSCFVYSKEEPKGMECIDKFQHMQDCFRQHPEIYGAELDDEELQGEPGDDIAQPRPVPVETGATAAKEAEAATTSGGDDSSDGVAPAVAEETKSSTKGATNAAEAEAAHGASELETPIVSSASEPTPENPTVGAASADVTSAPAPLVATDAAHSEAKSPLFEEDKLVPKEAWDATNANTAEKK